MTARQASSLFALLLAIPACGNLTDANAIVVKTLYTSSGDLAVFTSGGIKVYDGDLAHEKMSVRVLGERADWEPGSAGLSTDGQVASVTYGDGQTAVYGLPGGNVLASIVPEPTESMQSGALSPSGDLLFVYGGRNFSPDTKWSKLQSGLMYRTSDGSLLWEIQYPDPLKANEHCFIGGPDNSPRFAADEKTLYVPYFGTLLAVDTGTGVAQVLLDARACISGMTFLADGSLLIHRGFGRFPYTRDGQTPPADTAEDESFAIYNLDGTLVRELPAFPGYVTDGTWTAAETPLACSSDGQTCAMPVSRGTLSLDTETYVHRTGGGLLVWRLDGTIVSLIPVTAYPRNVAFSPDGTRLAATEDAARVYDIADGSVVAVRRYSKGLF
jgi:WD40 repeat protein